MAALTSPTQWQRSLFPAEYREKIGVIFDGIDTNLWRPGPKPTAVAGIELPAGAKVVTYATRGMESMRGFDLFMRFAKRILAARPDVTVLVAG